MHPLDLHPASSVHPCTLQLCSCALYDAGPCHLGAKPNGRQDCLCVIPALTKAASLSSTPLYTKLEQEPQREAGKGLTRQALIRIAGCLMRGPRAARQRQMLASVLDTRPAKTLELHLTAAPGNALSTLAMPPAHSDPKEFD
jgi:hypothetical protein